MALKRDPDRRLTRLDLASGLEEKFGNSQVVAIAVARLPHAHDGVAVVEEAAKVQSIAGRTVIGKGRRLRGHPQMFCIRSRRVKLRL